MPAPPRATYCQSQTDRSCCEDISIAGPSAERGLCPKCNMMTSLTLYIPRLFRKWSHLNRAQRLHATGSRFLSLSLSSRSPPPTPTHTPPWVHHPHDLNAWDLLLCSHQSRLGFFITMVTLSEKCTPHDSRGRDVPPTLFSEKYWRAPITVIAAATRKASR